MILVVLSPRMREPQINYVMNSKPTSRNQGSKSKKGFKAPFPNPNQISRKFRKRGSTGKEQFLVVQYPRHIYNSFGHLLLFSISSYKQHN